MFSPEAKRVTDREFTLELKRQLAHLFLGLAIAYVVYHIKSNLILIPLAVTLFLLYIIPKTTPNLKISNHLLYHFERDHDKINFPFKGPIWYGIGIMPPILFLPIDVACAVIAILSVGDSTSTLIGKFLGRVRIGEKSLEGFLAFLIFSLPAALLFISNWQLALTLALSGAIIEFFTFMDDNFLIPAGLTILYHTLNIITPNLII